MVPIGGALAGFVGAGLVPHYGWQILFQIGGIAPIVFALAAIFGLPESIKFMTLHESQRTKLEALIAAIRPDFKVPPNARFVIEDEQQSPSSNPIYLFGNGLAVITPLTWLMFALNLMGYFFLISWTPTLMTAAHVPPSTAALGRRDVAGRRHGRRAGAVLVAAAASLPRHCDPVRHRRAHRGLDRLCRPKLDGGAADGDLLRRRHRARHPGAASTSSAR